ncbi:MAG: dTDP-4-dehydrorhamnose 3,5-epimerase [Candidatus Marinimicrobia bacterium]|jgi:dTDP-4-dehydrorhamnose 3,5-epimerase|nr:dTDP-4-dehydrorhamnose 3,5-epimerase [Candidatus Neomarinimicrobiota bacterium]|tara:strand:- start:610 stop:1161 length:552 start_codon:yes stop_codon:yes gene_type:complete
MDLEKTNLEGVIVLRPKKYDDPRGFFTEIYSKSRYKTELISEESVQFNFSHSKKDVLRGLHFQMKKPQGKIVQVLRGTIFDVGVDIRKGSKTFGEYFSIELNSNDCTQVYFPPGIAHGFCVLSNSADVLYQCTEYYHPSDENGIIWNDQEINISWPIRNPVISNKDMEFKLLSELSDNELPSI